VDSQPDITPRTPVCRQVTDWETRTEVVTRMVPQIIPCQHCACTYYGCGCLHQTDRILVPHQVPVTERVPVTRTVCQ
jgi:hypothetical protein